MIYSFKNNFCFSSSVFISETVFYGFFTSWIRIDSDPDPGGLLYYGSGFENAEYST